MKVIAILNQKGGVGKTSTAAALSAGLSQIHGERVLAVDLDAQGNFSTQAGLDRGAPSLWDCLTGSTAVKDAIQQSAQGYAVLQSSRKLFTADIVLSEKKQREQYLKKILEQVDGDYNFVVIDCPPALNILTTNAMTAADFLIIPTEADLYALQGIGGMSENIKLIKEYCNNRLAVLGVLITKLDKRSIIARDMLSAAAGIAAKIGTSLYSADIPQGVAIKEAAALQKSIFDYAPKSKAALAYQEFIKETIQRMKGEI